MVEVLLHTRPPLRELAPHPVPNQTTMLVKKVQKSAARCQPYDVFLKQNVEGSLLRWVFVQLFAKKLNQIKNMISRN